MDGLFEGLEIIPAIPSRRRMHGAMDFIALTCPVLRGAHASQTLAVVEHPHRFVVLLHPVHAVRDEMVHLENNAPDSQATRREMQMCCFFAARCTSQSGTRWVSTSHTQGTVRGDALQFTAWISISRKGCVSPQSSSKLRRTFSNQVLSCSSQRGCLHEAAQIPLLSKRVP